MGPVTVSTGCFTWYGQTNCLIGDQGVLLKRLLSRLANLMFPANGAVAPFHLALNYSPASQAAPSVSNPVSRTVPTRPIRPRSRTSGREPNRVGDRRNRIALVGRLALFYPPHGSNRLSHRTARILTNVIL